MYMYTGYCDPILSASPLIPPMYHTHLDTSYFNQEHGGPQYVASMERSELDTIHIHLLDTGV